jgi:hypothetical protein
MRCAYLPYDELTGEQKNRKRQEYETPNHSLTALHIISVSEITSTWSQAPVYHPCPARPQSFGIFR